MAQHGLSIGVHRINEKFIIVLTAVGKLTHDDYTQMMPLLEAALAAADKPVVDVLVDMSEFKGWQLRAAWDDFTLGLKHGRQFNKIALFGKPGWQERMSSVGNWFVSGEIRFFDDYDDAEKWLTA